MDEYICPECGSIGCDHDCPECDGLGCEHCDDAGTIYGEFECLACGNVWSA